MLQKNFYKPFNMPSIKIDPKILYKIITGVKSVPVEGFLFVENNLISSDQEDGGGEYVMIIKEVESGKFYSVSYCDWDIENTDDFDEDDEDDEEFDGRCDLTDTILEVVSKEEKIIRYYPAA